MVTELLTQSKRTGFSYCFIAIEKFILVEEMLHDQLDLTIFSKTISRLAQLKTELNGYKNVPIKV